MLATCRVCGVVYRWSGVPSVADAWCLKHPRTNLTRTKSKSAQIVDKTPARSGPAGLGERFRR